MQILPGDGVLTIRRDATENLVDELAPARETLLPFGQGRLAARFVVCVIGGSVACAVDDFTEVGGSRSGKEYELAARINSMLAKKLLEDTLVKETLSRPTAAGCSLLDLLMARRLVRVLDDNIVDCVQGFDCDRRDRHVFKEVNQMGRHSHIVIGVAGTGRRPSCLRHLHPPVRLTVR